MINQDVIYWLWLSARCDVASKCFDVLMQKYDDPFDLYRLENEEIEQLGGISNRLKEKLCDKNLAAAYDTLKYCTRNGVDIITYADPRYPLRLKMIEDPPILLYCKGHFPSFNTSLCVGIVGTRKMSEYGKQSAYKIGYELAATGVVTVSGMAKGIDGVAACGALAAKGITVAVLGCGLETVYPNEHKALMDEISRHGAVITEYPPKELPHGYNFPKRNRIISGLCQAVAVIEAPVGSGALITAKDAIAQGRQVFALPGKVSDEGAQGPNELIRSGAFPMLCTTDLLRHYEFLYGDVLNMKALERASAESTDVDKSPQRYGLHYAIAERADENKEAHRRVTLKRKKKRPDGDAPSESSDAGREAVSEQPRGESRAECSVDELDPLTRSVLLAIPFDKPISADAICVRGASVAELLTALTMLEIRGFVTSLPGGMYVRI